MHYDNHVNNDDDINYDNDINWDNRINYDSDIDYDNDMDNEDIFTPKKSLPIITKWMASTFLLQLLSCIYYSSNNNIFHNRGSKQKWHIAPRKYICRVTF